MIVPAVLILLGAFVTLAIVLGAELLHRRAIAAAWRACPEHGPHCDGPRCCCIDKHAGGAA